MKKYTVLYREPKLSALEPPLGFLCDAENSEHAKEQCLSAYPNTCAIGVYLTAEFFNFPTD